MTLVFTGKGLFFLDKQVPNPWWITFIGKTLFAYILFCRVRVCHTLDYSYLTFAVAYKVKVTPYPKKQEHKHFWKHNLKEVVKSMKSRLLSIDPALSRHCRQSWLKRLKVNQRGRSEINDTSNHQNPRIHQLSEKTCVYSILDFCSAFLLMWIFVFSNPASFAHLHLHFPKDCWHQ